MAFHAFSKHQGFQMDMWCGVEMQIFIGTLSWNKVSLLAWHEPGHSEDQVIHYNSVRKDKNKE